jgi:large subunit ribosomal protein L7Ae
LKDSYDDTCYFGKWRICSLYIVTRKMDYYSIIERSRKTGKVDKGVNEVTKAVERGVAKLVVYATDVDPKEIVGHFKALCKEKGVKCVEVDSKQKLGISVGIKVNTAAVAVIEAGDTQKEIESIK